MLPYVLFYWLVTGFTLFVMIYSKKPYHLGAVTSFDFVMSMIFGGIFVPALLLVKITRA